MLSTHTVSAESSINAPIEKVWAILSDLGKYSEWNELTPRIDVTNKNGDNITRKPEIGDNVVLHVRWIGSEKIFPTKAKITMYDEVKKSLAWGVTFGLSFVLKTNREQTLTVIDQDTTKYTSTEEFSGILAPLVMKLHRGKIKAGFDYVADTLKKSSEAVK